MSGRRLIAREPLETRPVDKVEVQPAGLIEIVPGDTASGSFKKVLVGALAAKDGLVRKIRGFCDIDEGYVEGGTITASAKGYAGDQQD
jgi:hypothetical protein